MDIKLNSPVAPNLTLLNKYLESVNQSGWYTNFGPLHQELTCRLEDYLGVKNLLLVSNGTLALQVAYKTLGIKSAITTPFSFVATSSSLAWQNIPFEYSDIDKKTLNINSDKVNQIIGNSEKNKAIVATHVFGNPCDVEELDEIGDKKNVSIIYDAAHAFGVKYKNKSILSYGDASTLSFHATKVFHTVEGGAIVFKKKDDYEHAKSLINFAITPDKIIDGVGINAKLNEYQCAVGLVILDEIDLILAKRVNYFDLYRESLKNDCDTPLWQKNTSFNGSYMPIILESEKQLINVNNALKANNIESRRYFSPSLCTIFKNACNYSTSNSKDVSQRVLCLPLHFNMTTEDTQKVINTVKEGLK